MMRSDLVFALVVGVLLILLVILSRWLCHGGKATPAVAKLLRAKRDPKSFWGFLHDPPNMRCTAYLGICGVQEYAG